jgi:hypothetical protein
MSWILCDGWRCTIPPVQHYRRRYRPVGAAGLGAYAFVPGVYLSGLVGQATWNEVLATGAAAFGVIAISFAVVAIIMKEEKFLAGVAAVLGIAAIIAQVWWALIIVAVAIVILNSLLS